MEPRGVVPASFSRRSALTGMGVYLVCCVAALGLMLHVTQGHLVFTLDDPMIHMALARGIAHGHYGINLGEASSPSSSILWPYLLAVFGRTAAMPWWALALNVGAGLGGVWVLGMIVEELPSRFSMRWKCALVVLAIFVANLVGLTFTGMEHTLQVTVCLACAFAVIRSYADRPVPAWCLVAALVAPMIRYEDVGITLAVAIALWARGRRAQAAGLLALSVAPLVLFSAYLHHLGLPLLPLSVMVKGGAGQGITGLHLLWELPLEAIRRTFTEFDRMVLLLVVTVLGYLGVTEQDKSRRMILAGVTLAALMHLLIGRFGLAHRYETYVVSFAACVALAAVGTRRTGGSPALLAAFLVVLGLQSYKALAVIPACSQSIYLQQFQMGRFLREIDPANAAVNDLGWVAYDKAPDQYVFDLIGLGSVEAARERRQTSAWEEQMVAEHHLGLVMRYRSFEGLGAVPASWTELGSLSEDLFYSSSARDCVIFYATPAADRRVLERQLAQFAATLPAGDSWLAPGQCTQLNRPRVVDRVLRRWHGTRASR